MVNQIIHDIVVFSIALTLPTYFVRGIDAAFKHYNTKRKARRYRKFKRECGCGPEVCCSSCDPKQFYKEEVSPNDY